MFYTLESNSVTQHFQNNTLGNKPVNENSVKKERELLQLAREILLQLVKNQLVKKANEYESDELINQKTELLANRIINIHKNLLGYYFGHDITSEEIKEASSIYSDALAFITTVQSMKKIGKPLEEIEKFLLDKSEMIPKKTIEVKKHSYGPEYELAENVLKMFNGGFMQHHIIEFLNTRKKDIESKSLNSK